MAEKRNSSKVVEAPRLSSSTSYSIGGKSYNSQDISHYRPQYTDKSVSRPNITRSTPSADVHSQVEAYKPSVNTQASVQGNSVNSSPIKSDNHIQTGSEMNRAAENRVYSQVEHYNSNNAYSTEKTTISSGINMTPRNVESIKTADEISNIKLVSRNHHQDSNSTTYTFECNIQGQRDVLTYTVSNYGEGARGYSIHTQSGNISGSLSSREMKRLDSYLDGHVKSYESAKGIGGYGVKTAPTGNYGGYTNNSVKNNIQTHPSNPSFTANGVAGSKDYSPSIPSVGVASGTGVALSVQQISELKASAARMGATANLTTGNIQYGTNVARAFTLTDKAKENLRAGKLLGESFMNGTESTGQFIRGLGNAAKHSIKTEAVNSLQKWKSEPMKNQLLSGGKMLLGKAESSLLQGDDFGTQSAGAVIAAGTLGATSFKAAQQASAFGVQGVKKVGNGIYQVSTTAGKAGITVGRTAKTIINKQVAPISKDAVKILKEQAIKSGLNNTQIAKNIVGKVNHVKNTYYTAVAKARHAGSTIVSGANKIKTAVDTSVKIVHGMANGTLTVNMAKASLDLYKNKLMRGIRTGVRKGAGVAVRGTATGATKLAFRGIPKAGRFLKRGIMTGAGAMMGSEDYAVQGVGYAMTTADVGIKTGIAGMKATGYTVKTAVKGGKSVYAGFKFIKNQGLKKSWDYAMYQLRMKILQAGRSIVSLLLTGAKMIGMKFVLPLILICIVGLVVMNGISSPIMAIGTIFSGVFNTSDTETEYNVRDYLLANDGVPAMSLNYRQELANRMQAEYIDNGGTKHIVRFYSNTGSSDAIEPTLEGVTSVFPTDEELVNMLQPMFNAIILMNYELQPTEAEAKELLTELFKGKPNANGVYEGGLFRITEPPLETVEQCGQAIADGKGEVDIHECGEVHAHSDCPNPIDGVHADYTCAECDYYDCEGHKGDKNCGMSSHSHSDSCYNETGEKICGMHEHSHDSWNSADDNGCYSTKYHEGRLDYDCGNAEFKCDGYTNCNKHQVIAYTLNLDGVYALTNKFFLKPINELSNINPRSDEQEEKLQNLKDYYEIFQEMMGQVAQQYGGGLTMSDLDGVEFVNGTRVQNQSVIDLALSQVGQQGGQPYWSYYGFQSRVEWCACFVNWCMRNTPSASGSYPTTSNNAYCPTLASHFQGAGQWGNKDYTNLVAGDVIFFDWEGDGETDHVGLVVGHDGEYVYTVEGNSGDAVKAKKYQIGSSVIFGYGLMNY